MDDETWLALDRIALRGSVRDPPTLAAHLPPGATELGLEAVRALKGGLARASGRDLIWMESQRRLLFGGYRSYGSPWSMLSPCRIGQLTVDVQRLATFHPNGRVREAAVEALSASDDDHALSYLLLRCNDWVAPVAARARSAVAGRLNRRHLVGWVHAYPIVLHMRTVTRRALGELLDLVPELLVTREARPALRDGLLTGPTDVRRACAMLASTLTRADRIALLGPAMRDSDVRVAVTAARALLDGASDAEVCELAPSLLDTPIADVRTQTLAALWTHSPPSAHGPTLRALFDPVRAVREVAQFELGRRDTVDFGSIYVDALATSRGRRLRVVIDAIAEGGVAAHAKRIAPFAQAASPRIRSAALRALARLDGDAHVRAFVDALTSPHPRVVREGREALARRAHLVNRAELHALIPVAGWTGRAALSLAAQLEYWDALATCLRAIPSANLRGTALPLLRRLVGRQCYTMPPDHGALEAAFSRVRDELPSDLATSLSAILRLIRPNR